MLDLKGSWQVGKRSMKMWGNSFKNIWLQWYCNDKRWYNDKWRYKHPKRSSPMNHERLTSLVFSNRIFTSPMNQEWLELLYLTSKDPSKLGSLIVTIQWAMIWWIPHNYFSLSSLPCRLWNCSDFNDCKYFIVYNDYTHAKLCSLQKINHRTMMILKVGAWTSRFSTWISNSHP